MSSKKTTIEDIARTANVSKSTVSRVLNDSTPVAEDKKRAVLAAMKELDFQPNLFARSLAGGKSMTVGIVTQNIGSPFYDSVTRGVISGLSNTGYAPLIVDGQWQAEIESEAIETLIGRQVDGLVIVGGNLSEYALEKIRERKPVIMVAREIETWPGQCVFLDNFQAGYDATNYLIQQGHRDIAHVTGIKSHQDAVRRYRGYTKALADAGIELNEELVFEGNFSGQSGVQAIETFIMRGVTFTALFAANDETAFGARLGLARRNLRVPEDVSIIGFDNQPISGFMTPPLTTIGQPALEMGIAAADALLHAIKDEPFEIPDMPSKLVIRESVQRIR